MTAYHWCQLTLRSDIELPELRPAREEPGARHDWRIRLDRGRAPRRADRHWFHHWRFPDGRRWLSLARYAGGYLARFPGLVDFDVRTGDREIACYRGAGTPLRTLRHLLLDQVLPLVAGDRDRLALHASVVAAGTNDAAAAGAVAFLGAAGNGKSTIAARLAQRGCPIVSDDCCLLVRRTGGFDVAPSYPGVRLRPDSVAHLFAGIRRPRDRVAHYSTKQRIAGPEAGVGFHEHPLPLRQLYVLAPIADLKSGDSADDPRTQRPRRAARPRELHFHLDVEDPGRVGDAFELAADVAASYEVRLLTFPGIWRELMRRRTPSWPTCCRRIEVAVIARGVHPSPRPLSGSLLVIDSRATSAVAFLPRSRLMRRSSRSRRPACDWAARGGPD